MKIIKFSAKWCWPCQVYWPIFEEWAKDKDYEIELVDIEENPERASEYRVMSIPTTIAVTPNPAWEGEIIVNSKVGILTIDDLNNFIKQ